MKSLMAPCPKRAHNKKKCQRRPAEDTAGLRRASHSSAAKSGVFLREYTPVQSIGISVSEYTHRHTHTGEYVCVPTGEYQHLFFSRKIALC